MSQIFICYSRQNKEKVKTLVDDLKELGHDVWFDEELTGAQVWWNEILLKIRECDTFVFALSPESQNDSPVCQLELKYASDLHKTILPVLVADGVSIKLLQSALSKKQHVDYIKRDIKTVLVLSKALNHLPASLPLPDPLPKLPEAPVSGLGKLKEQIESKEIFNREKQSDLLFQLEEGLRNINDTDEICDLLRQFSKRDDLNAKLYKKINTLL